MITGAKMEMVRRSIKFIRVARKMRPAIHHRKPRTANLTCGSDEMLAVSFSVSIVFRLPPYWVPYFTLRGSGRSAAYNGVAGHRR